VEERADRLVLVAAVFEHESGDDEQVRGVRDLRSETAVPAMRLVGERGGGEEPVGQPWRGGGAAMRRA
jgi:hypothetical protein